LVTRYARQPALPNYAPPFEDYTVVEVSAEGQVLTEISVFDLLDRNGLSGLLYMSTLDHSSLQVSGDTLHLNDVETFPAALAPGVFEVGDIMISLRNISTVLVFNPRTLKVTFVSTGRVLRQHDPDFIDGNTIAVFDNYPRDRAYSRIVTMSAVDPMQEVRVRFEGSRAQPFRTFKMGKHQYLPDGNVLVVESVNGRVMEIDRAGRIVWQYVNLVKDGVAGLIADAIRLPPTMDEAFFARAVSACRSN
jgi:hypothetical protein